MSDREKVIKAIETHLSTDISVGCDDCTYENDGWCVTRVLADALSLMKEQDVQSVLSNRVCEVEPLRYVRKGFCPNCHQEMEWLFNRKYCGFCGQAVKWE